MPEAVGSAAAGRRRRVRVTATVLVVIVEGVLLALVALFVVALLRSHAEILRRLAAIEARDPRPAATPSAPSPNAASAPAHDLVGETLAGDAVKLALGPGSPSTLLAFMSSGCSSCAPLWESLRDDTARVPTGMRVVIVCKGAESESVTRLAELAPTRAELLMSSAAWREYSVEASPHFVLVDGRSGRIAGRGSAASWEQLATLVSQAASDADPGAAAWRGSSASRAARAEEALARAGISAGHPSLYSSTEGSPT